MIYLAIETSCDETAAALLEVRSGETRPTLLREVISSQTTIHQLYGGVVPELASREHLFNLPLLVDGLLTAQSISLRDLAGIAVTRGPGLKGCLLIGLDYAKGVRVALNTPLVGVNHIEGHILAPMLDNPALEFPYLVLVVSGGHSEIHLVHGLGAYELITRTTDDAAGEAFDKSANLLGFPYPGGAALAALADSRDSSRFRLPKVMRHSPGLSFSGLKTAVSLMVAEHGADGDDEIRAEMAFAIQRAIIDALMLKLEEAISRTGVRSVAVTGGVAANAALRRSIAALPAVELFAPTALHCTDNAAMIGYAGVLRLLRGEEMALDADVIARWPVEGMV